MKNRLKIILSCCGLLAASIVLLLVFLLSGDGKDKSLYCSANDVEISVGDKIYDFYEVSKLNATISFSVSEENIIEINDEFIYGKSAGEVTVTMTVIFGEEKSETSFNVKVYAQNYRVAVTPIENCYLEGNTIYAQSNTIQIKVDLYDSLNNKISNFKYSINASGETNVSKNFYNIVLELTENCELTLQFDDLGIQITLNVII